MATVEVKVPETRCDRCDKRIVKQRERVVLQYDGIVHTGASNDSMALDLCGPCEESLRKWWARKAGGE